MKKLTGKGKHTVKSGNHPHTKWVKNEKRQKCKIIYSHNKELKKEKKWSHSVMCDSLRPHGL